MPRPRRLGLGAELEQLGLDAWTTDVLEEVDQSLDDSLKQQIVPVLLLLEIRYQRQLHFAFLAVLTRLRLLPLTILYQFELVIF